MNWKTAAPLIVAVLLGGIAAKVAHDMSVKRKAPVSSTVQLVVAKGAVAPGTQLSPEMVTAIPAPGNTLPAQSFSNVEELLGRVVTVPVADGQPMLENFLAPKGAAAGLQALLPPGSRAITIDVNEITGIAGLLVPGCKVDIVSTLTGSEPDKTVTRMVVQNVLITAVGPRMSAARPDGDKDQGGYRTVTLTVTPRQAQIIELASSSSRTRLVLRARGDDAAVDPNGVTFAELRGKQQAPTRTLTQSVSTTRPTTQPTPTWTALVIHGNTVSSVEYDLPDPSAADTFSGTDVRPALQP